MPVPAAVRRGVRVEMRAEGGETVRGAGLPGGEGANADQRSAAESAPCELFIGKGPHWATAVEACGGSGGFCRALTSP